MKTFVLVSLLFFGGLLFADIGDNLSYEKVKVKQGVKKGSTKNKCYMYVDINGNEEWDDKKEELHTIIEQSNPCKKILIYKSIKNVRTRDGSNSKEFDINIGTIIKKNSHIDIKEITIVDNSTISDGYFKSTANVGSSINTGGKTHLNNVRMSSTVKIDDSKIGSDILGELGMGMTQIELSNIGK
ncbi:MAG TPA: hypothetical protein ENK66_08210 [Arcobacter sp.]|nr:hypothetical protein [Arcobacter sp.]